MLPCGSASAYTALALRTLREASYSMTTYLIREVLIHEESAPYGAQSADVETIYPGFAANGGIA